MAYAQVTLADFEALAADVKAVPAETVPEFAFAGRSNVGKSTLINALCGRRGLARTSRTPGRTRALVFFKIALGPDTVFRFVDLPGYGYAKASKKERIGWQPLIESYVERRQSLRAVVVLIDARRGVQPPDIELVEWLQALGRTAVVVLTKMDEVPKPRRGALLAAVRRELVLPTLPLGFSAPEKLGREELWARLLQAAHQTAP